MLSDRKVNEDHRPTTAVCFSWRDLYSSWTETQIINSRLPVLSIPTFVCKPKLKKLGLSATCEQLNAKLHIFHTPLVVLSRIRNPRIIYDPG